MENETTFEGSLYDESKWRRCWLSNFHDGGWVIGEVEYQSGLHYVVNSDNSGQLLVHENYVGWL